MFKRFSFILLSLLALFQAQPAQAQVYFAPEAGAVFGKVNTQLLKDFYYTDVATKPKFSAQGGLGFQIFLNQTFAIQTGVFYQRLAYKNTYDNNSFPNILYPYTSTYDLHQGQIPVSLSYFHEMKGGSSVFVGLGGYAMAAFLAKVHSAGGSKNELDLGTGDDDFQKPFDAGALAYIGYQFRFGGFLRLQYAHGLVNLSTREEYYSSYSSSLSLTMGFRLQMKSRVPESKQW